MHFGQWQNFGGDIGDIYSLMQTYGEGKHVGLRYSIVLIVPSLMKNNFRTVEAKSCEDEAN